MQSLLLFKEIYIKKEGIFVRENLENKRRYYPLAQQSCGGDIGSVPYVCMCVRTFVRMFTFVIALGTSFIIQFRYNFTQVLGMTIPRTNLRFSVIVSRSRSH